MPQAIMPRDKFHLPHMLRQIARMSRLAMAPRKFKASFSGPCNREQEEARRQRQIATHGDRYWCPVWKE